MKKVFLWLAIILSLIVLPIIISGLAILEYDSGYRGTYYKIGTVLPRVSDWFNSLDFHKKGIRFKNHKMAKREPITSPEPDEVNWGRLTWSPLVKEDGFLFYSSFDYDKGRATDATVKLVDLKTNKILWKWEPDYKEILRKAPKFAKALKQEKPWRMDKTELGISDEKFIRPLHSILNKDGSIVMNLFNGPLVKLNKHGDIEFVLDHCFYNSIEKHRGEYYVPILTTDPTTGLKEEGIARINESGELLKTSTLSSILKSNRMEAHFYGNHVHDANMLHLNDIDIIRKTDEYFQEGDLMLSCRNNSTIYVYRPSTNIIVWHRVGPALHQHDVDYLGRGVFSIFGNDGLYTQKKSNQSLACSQNAISNIYFIDSRDGRTTKPFEAAFGYEKVKSMKEGRHRVLPEGNAVVQTEDSVVYRMGLRHVLWSFEDIQDGFRMNMQWSRYFKRNEIAKFWKESE